MREINCNKAKNGKLIKLIETDSYNPEFDIYANEKIVGKIGYDDQNGLYIMIEKNHQRKGYGLIGWIYFVDYLFKVKNYFFISSIPVNDISGQFHRKLGFDVSNGYKYVIFKDVFYQKHGEFLKSREERVNKFLSDFNVVSSFSCTIV